MHYSCHIFCHSTESPQSSAVVHEYFVSLISVEDVSAEGGFINADTMEMSLSFKMLTPDVSQGQI